MDGKKWMKIIITIMMIILTISGTFKKAEKST